MYGIPDEPRADLKGRIRGRKEALDAAALAESRALVMVDENHGADEPIPDILETLDEMLRQRSGTRDSSLSAHRREDTLSSMRATVSDVHGEPTADSRLTVLTSLSRICHLLVKAPSSTLSIEPETFGVCQASQTSKLSSPHMTARSWAFGRRPSDRG
ncbi:hypothetical protein DER44DRAFT_741467 [Fusarium oxysporum]|nr:hypothetical protein DER44DRAFT_741467 [Fusarium oxysporum]